MDEPREKYLFPWVGTIVLNILAFVTDITGYAHFVIPYEFNLGSNIEWSVNIFKCPLIIIIRKKVINTVYLIVLTFLKKALRFSLDGGVILFLLVRELPILSLSSLRLLSNPLWSTSTPNQ